MKKGMKVRLKPTDSWSRRRVYRHTSEEEQQEWYERLHEECKAGREVPYNCAGESKLAPRCTTIEAEDDDIFTVVRGRCCPTIGWHKQPKSALIRNNRTGEAGYILRAHLEIIQ
jgi:hypothetical protein